VRAVVDQAKRRAAALGKTVTFSMPTNATRLDDEALRWIADTGVRISLSVDGDEAAQAGRPLRSGGSSLPRAQAGLAAARRVLAPPPAVRMTVTPQNVASFSRSVRFFASLGVDALMVYPAFDQAWPAAAIDRFATESLDVAQWLASAFERGGAAPAVPRIDPWWTILRRLATGPRPRRREGPLPSCGAGTALIAVGVDGTLAPCHRFVFYGRDSGRAVTMGTLDDGVDDSVVRRFEGLRVESLRAGDAACADCGLLDLCTYGCAAINFAVTGRPDRIPEVVCSLVAAQVAACRHLHDRASGDPRYARALGLGLEWSLARASRALGARAAEILRATSSGDDDDDDRDHAR
jgi:uncharacterized protein